MMPLLALALQLQRPAILDQLAQSGRVLLIAQTPSQRLSESLRIAPGAPPTLGFKILEGKMRHRFGGLDLVLDDAGH